jgi:hypothetical protein
MRPVGLKTLKNKLSEYVRVAAGGETSLPIATALLRKLVLRTPLGVRCFQTHYCLDAFRQGWMTAPVSVGLGPPACKPVMTINELLTNLHRDREDR